MLMIGANDFWTVPVPIQDAGGTWGNFLHSLWRHSRVFRFLYMIRRTVQADEVEVLYSRPEAPDLGRGVIRYGEREFDLTWTGRSGHPVADWHLMLRTNIEAMADEARKAGIRLLLLTYASEGRAYGAANKVIRATARATETPLIDLGAAFRASCPDGSCPDLLFRDQHPTAKGYRRAATTILAARAETRDQRERRRQAR